VRAGHRCTWAASRWWRRVGEGEEVTVNQNRDTSPRRRPRRASSSSDPLIPARRGAAYAAVLRCAPRAWRGLSHFCSLRRPQESSCGRSTN
jgi:hypothetical protein